MFFLRSLSIKYRLFLIIVFIVVSFIAVASQSLIKAKADYITLKKQQTEHLVESSVSIVQHYFEKSQRDKLSTKEAKELVIETLSSIRYEKDNYFWIQDSADVMLMHPTNPQLINKNINDIKDANNLPFLKELSDKSKSSGGAWIEYEWRQANSTSTDTKTSYGAYFEPWGWVIASGMYMNEVDELHNDLIITMFIWIGLIALTCLVIISLISNSIVQPIIYTSDRMKEISEGDGDLTQSINVNGSDEMSSMATFFNLFIVKIKTILSKVSDSSSNLFADAENILSVAERTKSIAEKQNENTLSVATAIEEMTSSIEEVSRSANEAKSTIDLAQVSAEKGQQSLVSTASEINGLSSNINNVNGVISVLSDEVQNIGTVLEVISQIAEQTNLLALNAAIEAARAGEQGRGFAVVADEVRTLASRTGKSTQEIQEMISRLKDGAKNAVTAVEQSQASSLKTKQQADDANRAFVDVMDKLNSAISRNNEIAAATGQQSAAAMEISQNVCFLKDISDESLQAVQDLSIASGNLNENGKQMKSLVSQFII